MNFNLVNLIVIKFTLVLSEWRLEWSEDFNGPVLDPNKWFARDDNGICKWRSELKFSDKFFE